MIRVGMCNMDKSMSKGIEEMIADILNGYDRWTVERFDGETLVEAVEAGSFDCRLLFANIFENDEKMEAVLACIENAGINTDIIYITDDCQRVMNCYRNHAYAYILKPIHDSDMKREISQYFKEQNIHQRCLRITFGGRESYIPIDSILYIESRHRKLLIYTEDETYEYYSRLDDMEKELAGEHFIRCHQSYLVAVPYITDYKDDYVYVAGRPVPVSRKYRMHIQSVIYQAELSDICTSGIFVHDGTHKLSNTKGSLICVKGEYMGKIIRLVPEQQVIVGRSGDTADVIVNLPQVSRQHCKITYHENGDYYEVQDCSTNGTFINGDEHLKRGDVYAVKPGTNIVFGDDRYIYRLG